MEISLTASHLVLIRILGFKVLIFGLCFILYFLKLSAGIGFLKSTFHRSFNLFSYLQSKYKKCPAFASVICCDLLYFVVFFRIRNRLNAVKYIFRTFYH